MLNHRSSSFYHPCLQEADLTGEGKAYVIQSIRKPGVVEKPQECQRGEGNLSSLKDD